MPFAIRFLEIIKKDALISLCIQDTIFITPYALSMSMCLPRVSELHQNRDDTSLTIVSQQSVSNTESVQLVDERMKPQ